MCNSENFSSLLLKTIKAMQQLWHYRDFHLYTFVFIISLRQELLCPVPQELLVF